MNHFTRNYISSKIIHSIFKPKQLPHERHFEPSAQKHPYKFAILGGINFQSRNYEALTDNLDQLTDTARKSFLFTIAGGGKDRQALIDLVHQKNLKNNFEFAKISPDSNRVKYDMYYRSIAESDAVLVLPGPGYAEKKSHPHYPVPLLLANLLDQFIIGFHLRPTQSIPILFGNNQRSASKFLNTTLLEHLLLKKSSSTTRTCSQTFYDSIIPGLLAPKRSKRTSNTSKLLTQSKLLM